MRKSTLWFQIAVALSAINLGALGFAAAQGEAWHAAVHGVLALGLGLWAQRLSRGPVGRIEDARFEGLEIEVGKLRQELTETQERLDFTERLLAQVRESSRIGPQR